MLKKRSYLIILATAVIFALLLSSCNFNFGAPTVDTEKESFNTEDSSVEPSGRTDEETEPEELSTEETDTTEDPSTDDTTETEPESESETEIESESESEPESESETEPIETTPVVSVDPVLPTAVPTPTPTTAPVCSHAFDSTVIREATCVSGLTRHTCSKCGYSYDEETAPVIRHFVGACEYVSNGDGKTHKSICTRCGYTTVDHCGTGLSEVTQDLFICHCNSCKQVIYTLEYRPIIQDAFRVLNEQRVAAGLNPVEYDYSYQDFVDGRAKQIATVDFSHNGSMFAECIAKGPQTGRGVMVGGDFGPDTGWMGSTGHRKIIMASDITHVTISMYGISNHNYKTGFEIYWVLMAHGVILS